MQTYFRLRSIQHAYIYQKEIQMNSTKKQKNKAEWLIPTLLIALSLVPVLAGAARLSELASGAKVTPDNARFFASPLPVVIGTNNLVTNTILSSQRFYRLSNP